MLPIDLMININCILEHEKQQTDQVKDMMVDVEDISQ